MNIHLREWKRNDANRVVEILNNPKVKQYTSIMMDPYTLEDANNWIDFCEFCDKGFNINYAISDEEKLIGSISVNCLGGMHNRTGEIGYWLDEAYWRKGIVGKAIHEITEKAFEKLTINRIEAPVFVNNMGSRTIIERNGYELESIMKDRVYKNNQYYDLYMYVKFK